MDSHFLSPKESLLGSWCVELCSDMFVLGHGPRCELLQFCSVSFFQEDFIWDHRRPSVGRVLSPNLLVERGSWPRERQLEIGHFMFLKTHVHTQPLICFPPTRLGPHGLVPQGRWLTQGHPAQVWGQGQAFLPTGQDPIFPTTCLAHYGPSYSR